MYDLIVIGAGSGGLTAAIGGVKIGAKVLLVEKEESLGGDCTHYGCVPSKTLIYQSKIAKYKKTRIEDVLKKVQKTVKYVEKKSEDIENLKKEGIDVIIGSARFVNKNTIMINGKKISSKKFVIATGSRARVPQIEGIDKVDYLTNKNIFIPKKFASITIIGGGPIGCELGQAFSNFGIDVNIIEHNSRLLSREDKNASKLVMDEFLENGINIFCSQDVIKIDRKKRKKIVYLKNNKNNSKKALESDEILIAAGRLPNIEGLSLKKANVEYDDKGVKINSKTQTTNKNIYAIGDVARGLQFTHFANHQGRVALTNLIFRIPAKYDTVNVPKVTFTYPEVASIGDMNFKDGIVLEHNYKDVDRAITDDKQKGFFKIVVDKKGYIRGATIVGNSAGEMIGEISLVMKNNLKISSIADTVHPYPTYGYGLKDCANKFRALSYSDTKKKIVKAIFSLKGR